METIKETIEHLSQYKAEINRKLDNKGNFKHIGFTCKQGEYKLYWFNKTDKNVLDMAFHIASSKSELLLAIQILLKSINQL